MILGRVFNDKFHIIVDGSRTGQKDWSQARFFFKITFEFQTRLLKYLGFVDPGQRYKTFFCRSRNTGPLQQVNMHSKNPFVVKYVWKISWRVFQRKVS